MPDTFSLSAGVSFGLLAGIVSGVCYLFANRLPKHKTGEKQCVVQRKRHICGRCGGDELGGLLPCVCQHHEPVKFESGAWFLRQAQRALSLMPWSSTDKLEQIKEEECGSASGGERVRELLEAIAARLAGGPLEGTRVDSLYDHPAYLPHRSGRAASPSTRGAHAQLKRLVARVVEEAAALPALARYAAEPQTPTDATTYEDLLATAILNKVIERYQTESGSGGRSSGIHSASASPSPSEGSSPRSLTSRDTREITPPACDDASDWEEGDPAEGLELPKRVPFPEFGGDIVHTDNEFRDFDEVSGSDIQAVDGSWEENWLFQKKKIKNIQSAPVPMLVPNSNTQYRALIGDRDADDTTDLSDNASDAEDQEVEYRSDIQKVIDSKHVIGGKPKIEEDFEPDSLNIIDGSESYDQGHDNIINGDTVDSPKEINNINGYTQTIHNNDSKLVLSVDSGPVPKTEFNLKEEIHRTVLNGHATIISEDKVENIQTECISTNNNGSNTNTLSRSEREKDYEETVAIPVQRYADSLRRKHFDEPQDHSTPNAAKDDLIPGSIAYRERKKWLNYVEMPNNPYSPEAIKKRLSAKSTSSLFDTLTTKSEEFSDKITSNNESTPNTQEDILEIKNDNKNLKTSMSTDSLLEDRRSKSPSLIRLRDVMSEEVLRYKRYDRDYYVKEARSSSGERKKGSLSSSSSVSGSINRSTSLEAMETSPELLIKQFNSIAANRQYTTFAGKEQETVSITTMPTEYNNEIIIEYEDGNENSLFDGKVTYTDEDTDKKFEEILQIAYNSDKENFILNKTEEQEKSINIENSLSSSSLGDSIKIYNVQTGEIMKCKPEDKLSERYEADGDTIADNGVSEAAVTPTENSGENTLTQALQIIEHSTEIDDLPEHLPNVKELAKKFVIMESLKEQVKPLQPLKRQKSKENILNPEFKDRPANKLTYMHSLTARSISREFREELKLSMATPLTVPGGVKGIPEGEEVTRECSRPGSPVPEPGTIKTKLAFFESLKSKFSSK